MARNQNASGSGMASRLVVIALLVVAIGLYLRVVMVDPDSSGHAPTQQASLQILEGDSPPPPSSDLRDLPEDQTMLIRQVFAPEMN